MSIEYDEKGKYFTDVVSKVAVRAVIQTTSHLIRGFVHVRRGKRLKDELELDEQFLAVTEAVIEDTGGKTVYTTEFIALQRGQIIWVMPAAEETEGAE